MSLAAVVLDFDGIVLESVDVKTRAFVTLFADAPEHQAEIVKLHVDNAGMSRYEKFRRIYADILRLPLDEDEERRLGEAFSACVFEEILRCPFVPGAPEFIERARRSLPLYVASGTPEEELRAIVERRGLGGWFDGVYGTPRPKAEILDAIAGELGCPAERLLMVGDARVDHDAAAAVGAHFVGRRLAGAEAAFPVDGAILVVEDLMELDRRWAEVTAAVDRRLSVPTR